MNKIINFMQLVAVFLLLAATNSYADQWVIDRQSSQLNFITIKQAQFVELNQFNYFKGGLNAKGQFNLTIDLASVDTKVALRDDRIRRFLFQVDKFASASLTANFDKKMIDMLMPGEHISLAVEATLSLHDEQEVMGIDVLIIKLTDTKLVAVSTEPVMVHAADFSLLNGIEKLRTLVQLNSITHTVPVTFYLVLNAAK